MVSTQATSTTRFRPIRTASGSCARGQSVHEPQSLLEGRQRIVSARDLSEAPVSDELASLREQFGFGIAHIAVLIVTRHDIAIRPVRPI